MKFISPIKVLATKVRSFILNLNQYRNTHYRVLNNCKINYKEAMKSQIKSAPVFKKILCVYKVFFGSKRQFDLGNVCCVHEKFFEDALVELGKLEDDNVNFIPIVVYLYGGLDKDNPRVEITIEEFNKEGIDKVIDMMYNTYKEVQ